jgi:hypothetical protein
MNARIHHDVAFATALLLTDPLVNVLDEWELGEFRAFCYETVKGALEAYDNAILDEQEGPSNEFPPSNN